MRTIRPSIAPWALIVIVILAIAACGGSASRVLAPVGDGLAAASAAPAAPDQGEGTGFTGGEMPAASGAPVEPGDGVGAVIDDAKIIRTGTIDLEVSDVPSALLTARDGIRAMGGYVGASETFSEGDSPRARITYRIPADRWEDALDLLRGLNGLTSKVVQEQTQAVEVTGQVIDLEARIRNLRASETALQEIAAGATRISDVLEVQAQLTSVRGQIEQLSAQLGDLEDRSSFATLTATFAVPVVAVEIAQKGWEPGVVVDEASASLVQVLQGLTTAGIWFAIVWLPILIVLAIVVGVGLWIARRIGLLGRRGHGEVAQLP
jgi:hypothetical protein